jgi:2-methylcitrate dehydratase PrpD
MSPNSIMQQLAQFAVASRWSDLPSSIVHETRLFLMDTVGCALGALSTDKGKINLALAPRYGGPPEASVIGSDNRVSLATAALVNGELMFTMDFTAMVAGGNEPAYILPAILATAESAKASGKELIMATAIGLEISSRLARAVLRQVTDLQEARPLPPLKLRRTGNAYSNIGAAAGAGRLLKLDGEKMAHAMGIAGHLCKIPTHGRYGSAGRRWTLKYGAPGWQSTGAVTATLYAQMGYTGDLTQLDDPENGFWYFAGYQDWRPANITADLGKTWLYTYRMHYKPYPCCALFHGQLDCFYDILEKHDLKAEEIESVRIYGRVGMDHPLYGNPEIKTIADAEFNPRYFFAAAAHRVRPGIAWLEAATMADPKILRFMDRVAFEENPQTNAPARCEVVARGRAFTAEREFSYGTVGTPAAMTDDELIAKFRHNAEQVLPQEKIDRAVETFFKLDKINDISRLTREITLIKD